MEVQNKALRQHSVNDILRQRNSLNRLESVRDILNSLSHMVFILNSRGEIVMANNLLLSKLNIKEDIDIIGKKPGDALGCIYAYKGHDGCGTIDYCTHCNALDIIVKSANNNTTLSNEVRLTVNINGIEEVLYLEIKASPIKTRKEHFTLFDAKDITFNKRKNLLEQTFYHDIINLAGSLDGIMESMETMNEDERRKFIKTARRISNSLIEEVVAQQELVKAENNSLSVQPEAYELNELIGDAIENIKHHDVAKRKLIHYETNLTDEGIITDKVLFNRTLTNMVKNALEASKVNETVTIFAKKKNHDIVIEVHNNFVMPAEVQNQIFKRPFSTKSAGRGIGTYSMKLFAEKYLNGKIGFSSSPEKGTSFYMALPQKFM